MNIIDEYLSYVANTEPPTTFHRWSFLTCIGALLERNISYGSQDFAVFPNLYVMLMGESGTRKNTAVNIAKNLLRKTGYSFISAEQTSKEMYLQDLGDVHTAFEGDAGDIASATLFGPNAARENLATPSFIVAPEFNDFIGNGNIEFMSWLGNLWDYKGVYEKKLKTSRNVSIPNPTISILGGNTPTGFSIAFPPTAIGQGFFSRIIFIHGVSTGRKIHKPSLGNQDIASYLIHVKNHMHGAMKDTRGADNMLRAIYENYGQMDDPRFQSYGTRRESQLHKLCMIGAALRMSMVITEADVLLANTILTHAECLMPKALGEFGRAKASNVSHAILSIIQNASGLVTPDELWKQVSHDLDSGAQFQDIMHKLQAAGKIMVDSVATKNGKRTGFLPIRRALIEKSEFVDFSLLTSEEREMKI